jgi:two-component system response regulator FlrC
MTHISILDEEIKGLDYIKARLEERDTFVSVIKSFEDLKNLQTSTLVVSEKKVKSDSEIINIARSLKVKKVILIDNQSKEFSIKKELGDALIKIMYPSNDIYGMEVFLSFCVEDQKFLTGSKESLSLKNLAKKVASTDVTVFINGPTGTGKEVVANYIHDNSSRAEKPFVAVNCAAIPENMLEAILFGHEKGSFTGASNANKGIFRAADSGTLLLDEISEMPLSLQAKLLRVLQERKVTPVGGTRDIEINVRIVATTNRDMIEEVKNNKFRQDLYYRLNVFPIRTVDLSKREEDIIPITVAMIKKHCENKKDFPFLHQAAQETLKKHCWSGNVRELENVILRALVLSNNKDINNDHILVDDNTNTENNNYQKLEDKIVAMGN